MNYEYGMAKIKIGGIEYILAPTLSNIKKIGTPKEIVQYFHILKYVECHFIASFRIAAKILLCCGLPEELVGQIIFSHNRGKSIVKPGMLPVDDVFILAWHCLMHGVCGVIDADDDHKDLKGEPLKSFNANAYIMDSVEFLGLSLTEAEGITMSHFVHLAKAKSDSAKSRKSEIDSQVKEPGKVSKKEEDDAMKWFESIESKMNDSHRKKL